MKLLTPLAAIILLLTVTNIVFAQRPQNRSDQTMLAQSTPPLSFPQRPVLEDAAPSRRRVYTDSKRAREIERKKHLQLAINELQESGNRLLAIASETAAPDYRAVAKAAKRLGKSSQQLLKVISQQKPEIKAPAADNSEIAMLYPFAADLAKRALAIDNSALLDIIDVKKQAEISDALNEICQQAAFLRARALAAQHK